MENEIPQKLDEVLNEDLNYLKRLPVGTEERSKAIAEVERLHKLRVEEAKAKAEVRVKTTQNENEKIAQARQWKAQLLGILLNVGVEAFIAVGGWYMYSKWQTSQQIFELNGAPTNPMFRNLLSKMTPKLK